MAKINKNKSTDKEKYEKYFSKLSEADRIQVDHMITQSEYTYEEIAKVIQNDLNKCKEVTIRTLKDNLYKYNRYVLKPKILGEIDNIDVYKELLALKGDVDAMKELNVLYYHQRERLRRILLAETTAATEGRDGFMSKTHKDLAAQARREIKEARELLEKIANIQMKTGLLKVAPKLIHGEFTKDSEKDITKMTFKLSEGFMDHLDVIEGELFDEGIKLKEIEHDG